MKTDRGLDRAIRLARIQHLLHKNGRGLTTRELAHLCGVSVRTIERDILSLQTDLAVPLTKRGDRYGILDSYLLPPVSFTLYETMALTLAARLVLRQTDEANPHTESALIKLAGMLPSGACDQLKQSAKNLRKKPHDATYLRVFERVAIAWCTQRRLKIRYQSLRSEETREWLLDPYFVDMTGAGFSTYVIGQASREGRSGLITFKLDRIRDIEILEEGFEIPPDADLDELLKSSWGIMRGDETVVKLKFSPQVTRRVKESVWHPSQVIEDLPDGGCLLTVKVASTLEMSPWIRSWGPEVEVLEPAGLREEFRGWARKLWEMYTN